MFITEEKSFSKLLEEIFQIILILEERRLGFFCCLFNYYSFIGTTTAEYQSDRFQSFSDRYLRTVLKQLTTGYGQIQLRIDLATEYRFTVLQVFLHTVYTMYYTVVPLPVVLKYQRRRSLPLYYSSRQERRVLCYQPSRYKLLSNRLGIKLRIGQQRLLECKSKVSTSGISEHNIPSTVYIAQNYSPALYLRV